VWIWICVAIVVVGLLIQVTLGWRIWRDLKGLFAAAGALERTASGVERELSSVGTKRLPAPQGARHGMEVDRRA
jgi:hypothetical protein